MQKNKRRVCLTAAGVLLIAALISCSGCTDESGTATSVPTDTITTVTTTAVSTIIVSDNPIETTIVKLEERYRPDGTRYYEAVVDVHNTADEPLKSVTIFFSLVDTETNETYSRKTQFVEYFSADETKQFSKNLDSEADHLYRLDVSVIV